MPVLDHITPIGIITKIRIISLLLLLVPVYFLVVVIFMGVGSRRHCSGTRRYFLVLSWF
jgi:hypothetical protein